MTSDPPTDGGRLRAVALRYDEAEGAQGLAPRIVATGQGTIAEAILAKAREHGVPVHESRELVAALMHFDLDQRIPPALYVAVAEVLTWAYRLEHQLEHPRAKGSDSDVERAAHAGPVAQRKS